MTLRWLRAPKPKRQPIGAPLVSVDRDEQVGNRILRLRTQSWLYNDYLEDEPCRVVKQTLKFCKIAKNKVNLLCCPGGVSPASVAVVDPATGDI